jgi:hypothetical protein
MENESSLRINVKTNESDGKNIWINFSMGENFQRKKNAFFIYKRGKIFDGAQRVWFLSLGAQV